MHQNRIAIIKSCANCPRAKYERYGLYCFELHKVIPPSKHEPMADFYKTIPDECPLPKEVPE